MIIIAGDMLIKEKVVSDGFSAAKKLLVLFLLKVLEDKSRYNTCETPAKSNATILHLWKS